MSRARRCARGNGSSASIWSGHVTASYGTLLADELGAQQGPITGFSFDISGAPSATRGIRVGISTAGGGNESYFKEYPVPTQDATVTLSEVMQGSWVTPSTPLDPTQLLEVHFLIYPGPDGATPFDFCVSNFRVLQSSSTAK